MKTTPEQRDRMAQAFQKSSLNKQLSAEKRLEARGQAKRWRILAKWGRERLARNSCKSPQKLQQDNNP